MACAFSEDAEECATAHWSKALDGRREPNGQWRADCPVPGCRSGRRALEYDAPGKHVRWKSFCGEHDKDAVRPFLAKAIGQCMPGGQPRKTATAADLRALALSGLQPLPIKVQLLIWSGATMPEALDELEVNRTVRYKVRDDLSSFGDKLAGQ